MDAQPKKKAFLFRVVVSVIAIAHIFDMGLKFIEQMN